MSTGTVALTDRVSARERVGVIRPRRTVSASFAGFRFPPDVILLAVRWYLRYGLSYGCEATGQKRMFEGVEFV